MNESAVTLAILAGGRGQRMGKPKALLKIGDQPILSYLIERFEWEGPTMLVTSPGREKPPGAEGFDVEVIDPVEGMGPVQGVLTALENAQTKTVLMASVDMPLVGREHLLWLVDQLGDSCGLMIKRENQIEPFPSIFRKVRHEMVPSMRSFASIEGFAVLSAPTAWPDDIWTNLNEPGDLAALQNSIKNAR